MRKAVTWAMPMLSTQESPLLFVLCRLWVPNWSSTAVTYDMAGSGSLTLFRASPLNLSLWPLRSVRRASSATHLAEPIATVITDALPRATKGSHHGRVVVARRLALTFSARGLLVSGSRWMGQRRQLGITIVA